MHIKIAVCDDDIKIQFSVEGFLQHLLHEYGIASEIECFDQGDKLCDAYEKGKFDLIFLDIEFEGKNGVEVGRYIRETVGDETVQIAYISGNTGYAMELFEYRPINFLIKPIREEEIKRSLTNIYSLGIRMQRIFNIKLARISSRWPCRKFDIFPAVQEKSSCTAEKRKRSFTAPWKPSTIK